MQKNPTNIALSPDIQKRLRVLAAQMGKRPSHIVEKILSEALPELELQAKADENKTP